MGEPKFSRPKFDTPPHPWKKARIEEEHLIQANHGLKNMREIWKSKSQLRRHRRQAMRFAASSFQTYDPAGFCGWCFLTFLSVAPRGKQLVGSLSYVEQVTDNDVARIKYAARWGLIH